MITYIWVNAAVAAPTIWHTMKQLARTISWYLNADSPRQERAVPCLGTASPVEGYQLVDATTVSDCDRPVLSCPVQSCCSVRAISEAPQLPGEPRGD